MTVDYATANGTRLAPGDYAAASGHARPSPPARPRRRSPSRSTATSPTRAPRRSPSTSRTRRNATIADAQGVGTIIDDDGAPTLVDQRRDGHGGQHRHGQRDASPSRCQPGQRADGQRRLLDGRRTAPRAPGDYTATGDSLVFAPGQTTQTVTVQVKGDLLDEIDESFTVDLSSRGQRHDRRRQRPRHDHRRRCAADHARSTTSTVTEGNTGTVNATFTVTPRRAERTDGHGRLRDGGRHGDGARPTTRPCRHASSSRQARRRRRSPSPVHGDLLDETNETFFVNLTNRVERDTSATRPGLGTITDDDPLPALSISDVTVTEGNAGTVDATFTVTLSRRQRPRRSRSTTPRPTARRLAPRRLHGRPAAHARPSPPGETTRRSRCRSTATCSTRPTRRSRSTCRAPVNATIADASASRARSPTTTPLPALSINDVDGDRGQLPARVARDVHRQPRARQRPDGDGALRHRRTARRSRRPTTRPRSGDAHLRARRDDADGSRSRSTATLLDEADETFSSTCPRPVNADNRGRPGHWARSPTTTALPSLSINDVTVDRGGRRHGRTRPSPSRSRAASGQTVTVDYATADGTAPRAGADYTATSRQPSRSRPARRRQTFTVPGRAATCSTRPTRRSSSTSTSPVNATIADGQGLGHDHRRRPAAHRSSINDVTVTEGNTGTVAATFTVNAHRAQRAAGDGRLRHRRRHGDRAGRLRGDEPARSTLRRRARRRRRSPCRSTATSSTRPTRRSRRPDERRPTRRSPTARASARSPTTTRRPRSRSTT